MVFKRKKRIRFHHCDPAGIVFYPQYLILCNEIVEDWLAEGLGVGLEVLLNEHKRGMPMRHLEAEYLLPGLQGDLLEFQLSVLRIGGSSLNLVIEAWGDNGMRFFCQQTVVWVDAESLKPIRIEDEWREKFGQYMKPNEAADSE
jgi:4-hydroxybenzoyl-CoA thioesterase